MTKPQYGEANPKMGDLVDALKINGPITVRHEGESYRLEYIGEFGYADEEGLAGDRSAEAGPAAGGDAEQ